MDRTRLTPLALATAAFVAAGGFIHLREWWETYRDVPSSVPGSWVVRVGFPVDVALSVVAVSALVGAVWTGRRLAMVAGGILAFQVGASVAAVVSREASLFGWTENGYNAAVRQAFAVQAGAALCVVALMALAGVEAGWGRSRSGAPATA